MRDDLLKFESGDDIYGQWEPTGPLFIRPSAVVSVEPKDDLFLDDGTTDAECCTVSFGGDRSRLVKGSADEVVARLRAGLTSEPASVEPRGSFNPLSLEALAVQEALGTFARFLELSTTTVKVEIPLPGGFVARIERPGRGE